MALKPRRLPYHEAVQERFGIDRAPLLLPRPQSRPVQEAGPHRADVVECGRSNDRDGVARHLRAGDHRIPHRTIRRDDRAKVRPHARNDVLRHRHARENKGQERSVTLKFPEWCRLTITRDLNCKERSFVGPKVHWLEAYAKWADTDVPNDMWANRPVGQLEKCAEAGALRRAFPEEIGNDLTAEEMAGQRIIDGAPLAPEKQKPESVTPPRVGGERKPLPPLVSQPKSPTEPAPAELSEQLAAQSQDDPEIPHAPAHATE